MHINYIVGDSNGDFLGNLHKTQAHRRRGDKLSLHIQVCEIYFYQEIKLQKEIQENDFTTL